MKIYRAIFFILSLYVCSNTIYANEPTNQHDEIPFILYVAQPKSGSEYMRETLRLGLNLTQAGWAEAGAFPNFMLDPRMFMDLLDKTNFYKTHLSALPPNINLLNKYVKKLVLHVRDPRQTVLSWVHYANKLYNDPSAKQHPSTMDSIHFMHPFQPIAKGYFEWDLQDQIDWCIENYYLTAVRWLEDWGKVIKNIDQYNFELLVVTCAELGNDREQYIKKILDFYGLPESRFKDPKAYYKQIMRNKDPMNEWKKSLTPKQLARLAELTPKTLLAQFGWEEYPVSHDHR